MPLFNMVCRKSCPNVLTEITCRICHTPNRSRETGLRTCEDIRHLGEYAVYYCEACGNGFTSPDIPPDHYELLPDVPDSSLSSGESILLRWFTERRVSKVESMVSGKNVMILDIGGGACAFANALARRGHAVTVIEPNQKNSRFADTARGVRFVAKMFSPEEISNGDLQPNSYDLITMWHSLEHTPDPLDVIKTAHVLLKPGGLLLISVPNFSSMLAEFGGNFWTYLDVPHHLCHFTPRGLRLILEQAGFTLQRSFRFSIEYDPFGWYQTLLNVISRSHNFFYNSRKKQRVDMAYVRFPRWAKVVTALGPLMLPLVGLFCLLTFTLSSPACVELSFRKEVG